MCAANLTAQDANPITFTLKSNAPPAPLKSGEKFTAQVIAQIKGGWHLYSLTQPAGGPAATRITLPGGQPFRLAGAIKTPSPLTDFDQNFGINTHFYEDSAIFTVPVTVASNATAGNAQLRINVFFQTCNDKYCLPPKTVKLTSPIRVAAGSTEAKPEEKQTPSPTPVGTAGQSPKIDNSVATEPVSPEPATEPAREAATPAENASAGQPLVLDNGFDPDQSLLSFVWLAMTVGALSLLTPCVFPMVPITVSYFANHAGKSRPAAVRNALVYAAGIILTFTALGMLLAVFVGAAGINRFAANPYINLLITAIFIGFAMNLLGAFEVQISSRLLTRLDAATRREGGSQVIGMLLMGLTFTLTSFTCTAPFVGTLLVMASQGAWQWPLVGMLAFSTVFALPFFVLALLPQLVAQLPRSGGWLNSVKVVMGLLEVAAAMKFLSNVDLVWRWGVFTREVVLASWVAITLIITFYLLGKFHLTHDSLVERIGAARLFSALISLSLSFYLITGLFGRRLGELESFLPPAAEGSSVSSGRAAGGQEELLWVLNDYEGALATARAEGKLVLIDFTGYTCTNCRWMEANMFPRREVRRELEKYVRVRLYTDGEGEPYERQQRLQEEKFGTVALPYYAVVDADGKPLAGFPGLTRSPDEFIAFLKKGRSGEPAGVKVGAGGTLGRIQKPYRLCGFARIRGRTGLLIQLS
jgi:thiol:disulfide interchange protein DsbD